LLLALGAGVMIVLFRTPLIELALHIVGGNDAVLVQARRFLEIGLTNEPRHWVRSNPQATAIAFLMRDDNGVAQLWLISPQGGEP
ncbi:hypothetical protein ONR49_26040, partial [Salmonella enterica subsp. enterica serovar Virginia]|nr:hypothetical protein [Salmonella enterica subsp. enterica serovar Virginia]